MSANLQREDVYRAASTISFPGEEELILRYWQQHKVFQVGQELSRGRQRFVFYDGPPFATGLPHYGHILAGTIKDIVTRCAYQRGYHVERKFGWDCHGLPVEYEIDKALGIKGPKDVEKIGIATYNEECRKIVMQYADEWRRIVGRTGRWIDFDNDYKTMYPWYMESIWWTFKQLYEKGLVYEGVKVMPFSTRCRTVLSNFEAGQNYRQIQDPSIIVALEIVQDPDNASFLIWTTTPWTLPANLAVCVHPCVIYVKVKDTRNCKCYVLSESGLEHVFKCADSYEVLSKYPGEKLAGLKYKPMFPYFEKHGAKMNCFRVLLDEYVSVDRGTGIVHQAPYFGEDDYRVCLKNGVITKTSPVVCPVDDSGHFTEEVVDFAGLYIKEADRHIIRALEQQEALFAVSQLVHSYPFCWRSDTPLIYRAIPSWFLRVEHMSQELLACTQQTNWVPDFVKSNRFGNWLKDVKDWAISRNRFWGTPIPIWSSSNRDEVVCIGSIRELEELSGCKVTDLHRESVDHIEIPSAIEGRPPLKRVAEVFDCWFESGSMPFAQHHYPFERQAEFHEYFPADFVAEGIDQTRGWFYTLLVVSAALLNKPPFRNLIASGLVLASDGQKMSKRKKNYCDPMKIMEIYGADALRLYLINSPVVRAENLQFKEDGVRDMVKKVLIPWYNAYRFLLQNIRRLEREGCTEYFYECKRTHKKIEKVNFMSTWIISCKEKLLDFIAEEMNSYRLYTIVPRLIKFVDQLTNWYVRLNRRCFKGEAGEEECVRSIDTLYDVLTTITKVAAPFTPFFSEYMYQRLSLFERKSKFLSVHYESMPLVDPSNIDNNVDDAMSRLQKVIELGRIIRMRCNLPSRHPVREVIVIHWSEEYLNSVESLEDLILSELNAKKLTRSQDIAAFGVQMRVKPNYKNLGSRLKDKMKIIARAIEQMSNAELQQCLAKGFFQIKDETIRTVDLHITYEMPAKPSNVEVFGDRDLLLLMDVEKTEKLQNEGIARDIVNHIQKLKKKANLLPADKVCVNFYPEDDFDETLDYFLEDVRPFIESEIKSPFMKLSNRKDYLRGILAEGKLNLKEKQVEILIMDEEGFSVMDAEPKVNVYLGEDIVGRYGASRAGSVLLKHSTGEYLTISELRQEVDRLFGLYGMRITMECDGNRICNVPDLASNDVYVHKDIG